MPKNLCQSFFAILFLFSFTRFTCITQLNFSSIQKTKSNMHAMSSIWSYSKTFRLSNVCYANFLNVSRLAQKKNYHDKLIGRHLPSLNSRHVHLDMKLIIGAQNNFLRVKLKRFWSLLYWTTFVKTSWLSL